MVELRGMTQEDAERRIANQASDEQRRAIADVVIDTGASVADTMRQADELWSQLQTLHAAELAEPVELHLGDRSDQ
jgi:dephospho-CoA kinase